MAADYRERAVDERARLRAHQQYVVQLEVPQPVELQLPDLWARANNTTVIRLGATVAPRHVGTYGGGGGLGVPGHS